MLLAFACTRAIGNTLSICLGNNIFRFFASYTSYTAICTILNDENKIKKFSLVICKIL